MKKPLTRDEAFNQDTFFYHDFDKETNMWCVFGNQSGFAYHTCSDKKEAQDRAEEMIAREKARFRRPDSNFDFLQ